MTSVGVDVSKEKSTVFAMDEEGQVFLAPTEFPHTINGINQLLTKLGEFPPPVRVILENTGYYHWPVVNSLLEACLFVSIVNPLIMSKFSKVQMRPGKLEPPKMMHPCGRR